MALLLLVISPGVGAQESTAGDGSAGQDAEKQVSESSSQKERFAFSGEDWADRLAEQMPEQVLWLEAPSQRFPALVTRDESGNPQGGALIVSEPGSSPATGWSEGIRQVLPKGGWYSLALPLASEAHQPLPKRVLPPKGSAPEGETADKADQPQAEPGAAAEKTARPENVTIDVAAGQATLRGEDYEKYVLERIEAGLTHLREQGYQNLVLIGVGRGAEWVSRYLAVNGSRFGPRGLGLVWVAPTFSLSPENLFDEVLGESFQRPLLDLTPGQDRHSERRRAAATRNGLKHYTQDRITQARAPSPAGARGVAQRIKGWLAQNMRGMQARPTR